MEKRNTGIALYNQSISNKARISGITLIALVVTLLFSYDYGRKM